MSDYDVVLDTLQKHHDKLMGMVNRNLNCEFLGLNIMDDIRLRQCDELKTAMRMWMDYKQACKDSDE